MKFTALGVNKKMEAEECCDNKKQTGGGFEGRSAIFLAQA
jgi:hypothetical protein